MKLRKLLCVVLLVTSVLIPSVPASAGGGSIEHGTIEHYVDCPYCGKGKGGSRVILPGSTHTFVLKAPDGTIHTDDYAAWDHNVEEDNNMEVEASITYSNPRGCFVDITANTCGRFWLSATTCTPTDPEDIVETRDARSACAYSLGGMICFYVDDEYTFVNEDKEDLPELLVGDSIQFYTTLYNKDNPKGTPLNISKDIYEYSAVTQKYFDLNASQDALVAKTPASKGCLISYLNNSIDEEEKHDDNIDYHYAGILSDSKVYKDGDTVSLEPTRDNSKVIKFVPSQSGIYGFFTKNASNQEYATAFIDDLRSTADFGTKIKTKHTYDSAARQTYVLSRKKLTAGTEYIVELANLNSSTEDFVLAPYPYTWPAE